MPKHVTYPGPHQSVTLPGRAEPVRQGVEIEVESDLADQLVEQGWTSAVQRAARDRASENADAPTPPPGRPARGETATAPVDTETAAAPPAG